MARQCDESMMKLRTAMHRADQLTDAEKRWLKRADARHLIECKNNNGLARNTFKRMGTRLTKEALVAPYVHGGYEVTIYGRLVLEIVREEKL